MITEENFLNLVKITNNIDEKNMPPGEYMWLFRGAKLAWVIYNILEHKTKTNAQITIESLLDKYNTINYFIIEYKKENDPKLKKLLKEYVITLPGMDYNLDNYEIQTIQENTKENYQWVLMYAKHIINKMNSELEKIKIYKELNNDIKTSIICTINNKKNKI